jgi:O-acetyl-ADP-ribose deacetylase (regulator of RNase III)
MLEYRKGDIFTAKDINVLAHGVNCRGAFGAGFAKKLAYKYPKARSHYIDKFYSKGWNLGEVQFIEIWPLCDRQMDTRWNGEDIFIIANMATQQGYGYDASQTQYVDYDAVAKCFQTLIDYAECHRLTVGMPKIGSGLAGGSWDTINGILQQCMQERKVHAIVYEL